MTMLRNFCAGAAALVLSIAPAIAQIGPALPTVSVSSIASTCPTSAAANGAVTIFGGIGVSAITANTDNIVAGDCGNAKTYASASGTAVALGSAVTLGAKFIVNLAATSASGTVTLTSAGGNFTSNGTTTFTFTAGQSIGLISDGTNWVVLKGTGSGGGSGTVNSGTSGQLSYYASTGTAVSGATTGTGVLTALGNALNAAGGLVGPTPSTSGDLAYYNGSTWIILAGNTTTTKILQETSAGVPSWVAASGSCSGSFCSLTAGTNWTTAIAATLNSTIATALANAPNGGTGNLVTQAAAITTGNCTKWGPGSADAGTVCAPAFNNSGYVSGQWYRSAQSVNPVTGTTFGVAGRIVCAPYTVSGPTGFTMKSLGVNMSTNDATNFATFAIYTAANNVPTTLVDSLSAPIQTNGTAPIAVSGAVANTTDVLAPGEYFSCTVANSTTVVFTGVSNAVGTLNGSSYGYASITAAASGSMVVGLSCSGGTAGCGPSWTSGSGGSYTWPASLASATWGTITAVLPNVFLQVN